MKILVVGSGGREHALCWKLAQSPGVQVFACPGNPGMARVATCVPGEPLAAAVRTSAELTVVGPEVPLVAGVVDAFRARGLRIVGPNAEAARLEGSKIFAKDFLQQRGIPTAAYTTVEDASHARMALGRFGFPVVLKADGLAAGKGVVIAHNASEAEAALATLKGRLVIEEFLTGDEVSFIALCDGHDALPLAASQDHKAVFDGDHGPNTGGMGAYCDAGILSEAHTRMVMERVILPTVEAMNFTGFLYAGLMITADGPKVLEFNVRLGDPETQPLMHRMQSDFVPALLAASEGKLAGQKLTWRAGPSVCVVLASAGYPGGYETGKEIRGLQMAEAKGATVFHAGTRVLHSRLETSGGRVLGVTASGADLPGAIAAAYEGVGHIDFEGMHYRRDIGSRGLGRSPAR
ncbi:MAG: phosphoribosylamine--glycine ligase [Candidatus Solibacter sp.]|nr:phosphoribosylamine--glycine ligase [Candidatus Solibacter sp.]